MCLSYVLKCIFVLVFSRGFEGEHSPTVDKSSITWEEHFKAELQGKKILVGPSKLPLMLYILNPDLCCGYILVVVLLDTICFNLPPLLLGFSADTVKDGVVYSSPSCPLSSIHKMSFHRIQGVL